MTYRNRRTMTQRDRHTQNLITRSITIRPLLAQTHIHVEHITRHVTTQFKHPCPYASYHESTISASPLTPSHTHPEKLVAAAQARLQSLPRNCRGVSTGQKRVTLGLSGRYGMSCGHRSNRGDDRFGGVSSKLRLRLLPTWVGLRTTVL